MMRGLLLLLFVALLFTIFCPASARGDAGDQIKVIQLEERVTKLESMVQHRDERAMPVVLLLFGVFCALWAQNTGRNAWLWFFLGFFFNIVTVLVLLSKNSADKRACDPVG